MQIKSAVEFTVLAIIIEVEELEFSRQRIGIQHSDLGMTHVVVSEVFDNKIENDFN